MRRYDLGAVGCNDNGSAMSEHDEQVAFFDFVEGKGLRKEFVIAACPNQRHAHIATGRRFKREGVLAGMPDVSVVAARHGYISLFLEFKFGANTLSPAQVGVARLLEAAGARYTVVYDADEGIAELTWYLGLEEAKQFQAARTRALLRMEKKKKRAKR